MACGEAPSAFVKQMQVTICQLCGKDMQCANQEQPNYQKQVDPPTNLYGTENRIVIKPDPIYHPPEYFAQNRVPFIVHTPTIEYRVTSEVRRKPANQPGVIYVMNHGATCRSDIETWVCKKKMMKEKNLSWVGDGNYVETRPDMLHFFGNTTHLFTKDPENPYGNTSPIPCNMKPRDGLDHY